VSLPQPSQSHVARQCRTRRMDSCTDITHKVCIYPRSHDGPCYTCTPKCTMMDSKIKIQLIINPDGHVSDTYAVLIAQIGVCGTNKVVSVDQLSTTYYIQTSYDLYNTVPICLLVVAAEQQMGCLLPRGPSSAALHWRASGHLASHPMSFLTPRLS